MLVGVPPKVVAWPVGSRRVPVVVVSSSVVASLSISGVAARAWTGSSCSPSCSSLKHDSAAWICC